MKPTVLSIALLALAAGPALAADEKPAASYSDKVERADGSGPAANAEAALHRGAKKTGHAVKQGAKKTGEAVGKGVRKTGDAVENAGEKLERKSQ